MGGEIPVSNARFDVHHREELAWKPEPERLDTALSYSRIGSAREQAGRRRCNAGAELTPRAVSCEWLNAACRRQQPGRSRKLGAKYWSDDARRDNTRGVKDNVMEIRGGRRLSGGRVSVAGSSNQVTKCIIASLLTNEDVTLRGAPEVNERKVVQELFEFLGGR